MAKIPAEKDPCICGAKHGKPHKPSCGYEECPFCHEQLIGCDCCYIKLNLDPNQEPVFSKGLNKKQSKEWNKILREKGLIPMGEEVMYTASGIWSDSRRKEITTEIIGEMEAAGKCRSRVTAHRVGRWSERLRALANASAVFLELNKNHILRGGPVKWRPPVRKFQR